MDVLHISLDSIFGAFWFGMLSKLLKWIDNTMGNIYRQSACLLVQLLISSCEHEIHFITLFFSKWKQNMTGHAPRSSWNIWKSPCQENYPWITCGNQGLTPYKQIFGPSQPIAHPSGGHSIQQLLCFFHHPHTYNISSINFGFCPWTNQFMPHKQIDSVNVSLLLRLVFHSPLVG